MTGLLNELSQWAKTLPYWEQAALDKIVNKGSAAFTDSDYEELIQYLLEDVNKQSPIQLRPVIQFSQNDGQDTGGQPLLLLEITNFTNYYIAGVCSGGRLNCGKKRLARHSEAISTSYKPSPLAMPLLEGP